MTDSASVSGENWSLLIKRFLWGLTIFYGVGFSWIYLSDRRRRAVVLDTGVHAYLHYQFVDVRLKTQDPQLIATWRKNPPQVAVLKNGITLSTIAGMKSILLDYDPSVGFFVGRWPCPWNAPVGKYDLKLLSNNPAIQKRLSSHGFKIIRRSPRPIPPGFAVLTLETVNPIKTMHVRGPDGKMGDWRGMLDWAKYIGADAFWMLGARTPGEHPGEVWTHDNRAMIPLIARAAHKRGLKFGVYVMCYLTTSKTRLPRYQYALDAGNGRTSFTRAISIDDPQRPKDIAAILKKFSEIPDVDFLGIDYIRNALGGYELADDFYKDMPGANPPPFWNKLSLEEKDVYLARKKIMRRDMKFIDAWQWWRAHKVALIVRKIKTELHARQPLWGFTLSWAKGWQHGQDPVMMNDAGVDIDAVMLYEATQPQFDALIDDWHGYLKHGDAQVIGGDVVDWNLHQKSPDGPKEFYRRSVEAVDRIYADGPAPGLFVHDVARALFGRTGPWGTKGWMDEAKRAIAYMRLKNSKPGTPLKNGGLAGLGVNPGAQAGPQPLSCRRSGPLSLREQGAQK